MSQVLGATHACPRCGKETLIVYSPKMDKHGHMFYSISAELIDKKIANLPGYRLRRMIRTGQGGTITYCVPRRRGVTLVERTELPDFKWNTFCLHCEGAGVQSS